MGEVPWSAAVARRDICARLARLAAKLNVLRINELIRTAKTMQSRTILKYKTDPDTHNLRLARWPEAAYGDETQGGRSLLDYFIALLPYSLQNSRHLIHWPSHFSRRAVKRCL